MKIMTVLGTRPEIIRLSRVIPLLDRHAEHLVVDTGQNFDDRLKRIFYEDLEVRKPDEFLAVRSPTFGGQLGQILERTEQVLLQHRPDRVLVLGDTNSGMSAIVARRLGIPVYHMEAGNRCYDDRVPEEVNRRVIDHSSTVLMPYTERSRQNLVAEGIAGSRIFVTGNPIAEVIDFYSARIDQSAALAELGIEEGRYFLVTMHRAENVDIPRRLRDLVEGLHRLAAKWCMPVVVSVHPRTRARMEEFGISSHARGIRFAQPFGFFDFVRLEKSAFCVLSDSGTVQEEACILGIPNVTIRDVTERPETVECGSNLLSGGDPERIVECVGLATQRRGGWSPPPEYRATAVSRVVANIVLGFRISDPAEQAWQERARQ